MSPTPRPHATIMDDNRNGLLDLTEWVNIGRVTEVDKNNRKLDLDVCEPAQDYFRAARDGTVSPEQRWRRMTSLNPRLRLSGEMEEYIRREQREWTRQHPPRKDASKPPSIA